MVTQVTEAIRFSYLLPELSVIISPAVQEGNLCLY